MRAQVCLFLTLFSFSHFFSPALFSSVVINEIMKDPAAVSDNDGEWFELHNTGDDPVDLGGWIVRDSGRDYHQISEDSGLVIPSGGYVVLGKNGDPALNGGYSPDYVYDGITLSNGEDEILLYDAVGALVDSVAYDGSNWPSDPGQSMEFIEGRTDNAAGDNWLSATELFGDGDMGTPGGENGAAGVGIGGGEPVGDQDAGSGRSALRNYPNPFRGSTTIIVNGITPMSEGFQRSVHSRSIVQLKVYDLHGRKVRDLWEGSPGTGSSVVWDGKDDRGVDLPPGVYVLRLTGRAGVIQRKVLLAGR